MKKLTDQYPNDLEAIKEFWAQQQNVDCPACNGRGRVTSVVICTACNGVGIVSKQDADEMRKHPSYQYAI